MTERTIRQANPELGKLDALVRLGAALPAGTEVNRLSQQLSGLPALPDNFNAAFAPRGWLFVEFACGWEAAQHALAMHSEGRDAAEIDGYLADNLLAITPLYYQALEHLGGGNADPKYPIRAAIAERAFKAFEDADYVVCVPLFLMLIDSFGISLSGSKSIFSDLAELDHLFEAEESVAGHPSGLKAVLKTMVIGNRGYSEDEITAARRNCILHGTRLNYGSKIVATKALNVLAGVIEWARDTATESEDAASRKRWNANFLTKNLARLNPRTPDEALSKLQKAFDDNRPADVVPLIDYHPIHTTLRAKIGDWRDMLDTYEVNVRRLASWEVFGEIADSEQHARCTVELSLRLKQSGVTSVTEGTVFASRSIELQRAGLPSVWQIALALQGMIRHRLPAET